MNMKAIWVLFQETFTEWSNDKASRLAAALSYYTIFSIAPLLIIVIAIAGAVLGQDEAKTAIRNQLEGLINQNAAGFIVQAIDSASQPRAGTIASLISIALLIFGATGVFAELQDALNTIWEVQPKPGRPVKTIVRQRFLSFTMILGIGFLLLVSLVISTVLQAIVAWFGNNLLTEAHVLLPLVNFILGFIVTTVLFGLIFKVLPDVKITWSDVWIGAALTSLLFSIGRFLLGYYLGRASFNSIYGAAGSIVVILVWVNYAAQILFFGAEFTQVYARKYGTRIIPDKNAIPITEEARLQQGMKPNDTPVKRQTNNKRSRTLINRLLRGLKQPRRRKIKRNQRF